MSSVVVTVGGTDYTSSCLFQQSSFEQLFGGAPGTFEIVLRDPDQTLSFTTGAEISLSIDGISAPPMLASVSRSEPLRRAGTLHIHDFCHGIPANYRPSMDVPAGNGSSVPSGDADRGGRTAMLAGALRRMFDNVVGGASRRDCPQTLGGPICIWQWVDVVGVGIVSVFSPALVLGLRDCMGGTNAYQVFPVLGLVSVGARPCMSSSPPAPDESSRPVLPLRDAWAQSNIGSCIGGQLSGHREWVRRRPCKRDDERDVTYKESPHSVWESRYSFDHNPSDRLAQSSLGIRQPWQTVARVFPLVKLARGEGVSLCQA